MEKTYNYPIFNGDIIYNIMLQSDIDTIHIINTSCKLIYDMYQTKKFWEDKFKRDFNDVVCNSNDWKTEYKHLYFAHTLATRFARMLALASSKGSLWYTTIYMRIIHNVSNICWLPKQLISDNLSHICFKVIQFEKGENLFDLVRINTDDTISINTDTFIGYVAKLMYAYPGIDFVDINGGSYMFKNLCKKQTLSFIENRRLFYWNLILLEKN